MVQYSAKSVKGDVRKKNEDYFGICSKNNTYPYLFTIADGIGGLKAGEIASKIAVNTVIEYFKKTPFEKQTFWEASEFLKFITTKTNEKLSEIARISKEINELGTTMSILILFEKEATIGHIGDSRIYEVDSKKYNLLTEDHTYINKLIKEGNISKEEAKSHPKRNMITKALGNGFEYDMDIISIKKCKNKKFILCTDGLFASENVLENIFEEINEMDVNQTTEYLIKKSLDNGGLDNTTIVTVLNE